MNNQTTNPPSEKNPTDSKQLKKTWQEPELIHFILNGGPQVFPSETGVFHALS